MIAATKAMTVESGSLEEQAPMKRTRTLQSLTTTTVQMMMVKERRQKSIFLRRRWKKKSQG